MRNRPSIPRWMKYHSIDSTSILTESTPIYTAFEVGIARMSNMASINTRLLAAITAYGGLGYFFGKGRDLSRKLFHITPQSSERIQNAHDALYSGAFNLIVSPPMYIISTLGAGEEPDAKKIAVGTALATGFGILNGAPIGYAVDIGRDLSGLQDCKRPTYPQILRKQPRPVKRMLLAGAVATSIALSGLMYAATPEQTVTEAVYETPTTH